MRPRVFSVDLVNYDDWLESVFKRFTQNKTRLRLWPIVGVDNQKYAVHHFHDALDFAAEIGVAGCIDNVDAVAVPLKGSILGANRDSFFTLEIHGIHYALFDLLIGTKRPRLAQQLIHKRRLAVIDVRNNSNVTNLIHRREAYRAGKPRNLR